MLNGSGVCLTITPALRSIGTSRTRPTRNRRGTPCRGRPRTGRCSSRLILVFAGKPAEVDALVLQERAELRPECGHLIRHRPQPATRKRFHIRVDLEAQRVRRVAALDDLRAVLGREEWCNLRPEV